MVAIKNVTRALCTTPACLQLADNFVKNLAPNYKDIDPCTNFEEMVCGGWRTRYQISPQQSSLDAMGVLSEETTSLLRSVLEGPYPGDSSHSHFSPRNLHPRDLSVDQENFSKLQTAYKACIDEETLKKVGLAPITDLLDRLKKTFGSDGDDWSAPSVFLQSIGASGLTYVYVASDLDDPDLQLLNLNFGAGFGLPNRNLYSNASILETQYVPVVADIFKAVHRTGNNSGAALDFTEQARQVVKLEADLAAISAPSNRSFYELAAKITFSNASALAPGLGLPKIVSALAPPGYLPKDILLYPAYLSNLSKVLDANPRSAVESYFAWRLILASRNYVLADEVFQPYLTLRNRLQGVNDLAPQPRWKTCLASARNSLGWILSRFFVETTFSAHDRDLSNQIISDIREVYAQKIKTLPWLDDPTRAKALEKIDMIVQKIGYPTDFPNITDPETLKRLYSNTSVTNSHFANQLSATNVSITNNFKQLLGPTDRKDWQDSFAVIINAFYSSDLNQIVFPAGILQPPIFGGDFPAAINYGAFGAIAGHEVSHGFDKNGRNFDGTGRMVNWWSDSVLAEYKKREQCFVDQFNNMTVFANDGKGNNTVGHKLNGQQTLGENEADSAGIVAAFDSWLLRKKLNGGQELGLPGLEEFTDEQLFFLAYGNIWCGKVSNDGLKLQVMNDAHSPNAARVQGTTANSRAFREAFGCKVKEPTCELW
ncbi:hypothetical protein B0T16DRAFT_514442 [Cercophora newfieldiana]|uniref:Uncharacterized protein n=1 Tax=Cercophora newfieldiana TaxID=92897 RepID=A0AA39XWC2_9PEZI|nr:hypothetical protein B0T16DRAFT_514442 [Cercophora newfieldiana]